MDTGVAHPTGKPAEHRPRVLPISHCHRASSRPNHPRAEKLSDEHGHLHVYLPQLTQPQVPAASLPRLTSRPAHLPVAVA